MRPISILLTAAGCPGASTCIRYLRGVRERAVTVVGTDANPEAIGRFMANRFHAVPVATDPSYIDRLLEVAIVEKVDALIPASSYEIEIVAQSAARFEEHGIRVVASEPEVLRVANNKERLYEACRDDPRIPLPEYRMARTLEEFLEAVESLGFPKTRVCFKPTFSKGSRGFRYLSHNMDRADLLLNYKPDSKFMSLEEFCEIFRGRPEFPDLLVMEVVEGEEIDTMVLGYQGEALLLTHKTRERDRGGVITQGELVERSALDDTLRAIAAKVPLSYNFGVQFIGGALIEINPRLSTFIYEDDFVEPYLAVKLALGEITAEDVRAYQRRVPVGLRMIRYFDQHFFTPQQALAR